LKQQVVSAQNLVDDALRYVKNHCSVGDRLDPELLDQHQLISYQLAICSAEISAADAMLNFAAEMSGDELIQQVVTAFCIETLFAIANRLQTHAVEMGLDRDTIGALYPSHGINVLAELGETVLTKDVTQLGTLLSEENQLVRATFARFADQVVKPVAEEIHRQNLDIPDHILKSAAELGCFGTSIPERFGGLQADDQADSLGMIVVTEELSRGSLGAAGSLITRPEIAARALLAGGTELQQQRWLPALASGASLCAIAITEPDYGSDVASIVLKATPTDSGWLLNGNKTWSTFAGKSDVLVVLARSNPDQSLGYKGLSLFIVEKPQFPGHEFQHRQQSGGKLTGKAIATIGYRGMHSFDLFFEDYFVPDENLIGQEPGQGFYHTMAGFAGGRIQTAARATGVMQAAYEAALAYARQRVVFGKAIGDYQLTQVKLARMLITITAARQFSYAVAKLLDQGGGQMQASQVKLFSCRAAEWVTREAMQIHGGMGYAEESSVSRYFVDARVLSIFEGAEETLALKVIARDLIKNA